MNHRLTTLALAYPHVLLLPAGMVLAMAWLWLGLPLAAGPVFWPDRLLPGLALAVGLFGWTLLEYLLHRCFLHGVEPFRAWHRLHHQQPDLPMRTPLLFSLPLLVALVGLPVGLLADLRLALPLSGGLLLGHLLQEIVHHRLHQPLAPAAGAWWRRCWQQHQRHHHGHEEANFGTLSAGWDRLFGTGAGR